MLPSRVRVDLRAIAMKKYSASPNLQYYWSLIIWWNESLAPPRRDTVSVFNSPSRLGWQILGSFLWAEKTFSFLVSLVNAKSIFVEEQRSYYVTCSWGNKKVYTFPKGISPKEKVIAHLELERTYYDVAIQHNSNYSAGTITNPKNCGTLK